MSNSPGMVKHDFERLEVCELNESLLSRTMPKILMFSGNKTEVPAKLIVILFVFMYGLVRVASSDICLSFCTVSY